MNGRRGPRPSCPSGSASDQARSPETQSPPTMMRRVAKVHQLKSRKRKKKRRKKTRKRKKRKRRRKKRKKKRKRNKYLTRQEPCIDDDSIYDHRQKIIQQQQQGSRLRDLTSETGNQMTVINNSEKLLLSSLKKDKTKA